MTNKLNFKQNVCVEDKKGQYRFVNGLVPRTATYAMVVNMEADSVIASRAISSISLLCM